MKFVFQRGTLLLPGDNVPPWVAALPGLLWDSRVGAWRAPAYRWPELQAELSKRGVRSEIDGYQSAGEPPLSKHGASPSNPVPDRLALRPYQDAALVAWELASRRGVIVLPTGAGKTRVGMAAMERVGARTLFLVPTRVLMTQWLDCLTAAGVSEPGCFGDGYRDLRRTTVATFESAWRHMETIGARFDLIVVDEAHHFGNGMRDEALEMAIAPMRLGLTATPRDGAWSARLNDLVGPVVYRLGINDLAGTYLAGFDRLTLTLDLTPLERRSYEGFMADFRRVHRAFLRQCPQAAWVDFVRTATRSTEGLHALGALRAAKALLHWPEAKRRVVASLLRKHQAERTLVFTPNNTTAYAIAREHLLMPITCEIARTERDAVLERFRTGSLRALVSSRVLNEGVDVPTAEIGIIVGGDQGQREHIQRVGRLLRPAPGKRATVYELVMAGTSEVFKAERRNKGLASRTPTPR